MSIRRNINGLLQEYLDLFPVVGILGPRQIGKTTLAKNVIADKEIHYLDLELSADRAKLFNTAMYFDLHKDKLIVLDEIQFMPELFAELRGIIDADRRPGRFLILGSASPNLIRKSADSLAGRIGYLELGTFMLSEIGPENQEELWLRGGFPLAFLAKTDRASLLWRNNFIKSYTEKEFNQFGLPAEAVVIEKYWRMLAYNNAQFWNAEQIARSMGLSSTTVNTYLNVMEGAFIIRKLLPYSVNLGKRLVKSPKIYLRDSGLLHAFFSIETQGDLYSQPIIGSSWEGFVIEQIALAVGANASLYFYRTHQGAECDLLIEKGGRVRAAIEIKIGVAPKISKGFYISMADTSAEKGIIIAKVNENYPVDAKVMVVSLAVFLE